MPQDGCTRRSVVGLTATSLALGLAGCASDGGNNETDGGQDGEDGLGGTPGDGGATLRVAHMSPSAPAVDVSVGGETVITGLAYTDVSDYLSVEPGSTQVRIEPSDGGQAVFEEEVDVAEGPQTAVALGDLPTGGAAGPDNATAGNATGNATGANVTGNATAGNATGNATGDGMAGAAGDGGFTVEVFEDETEAPGPDTASVRLIHASPDAPPVTVTAEAAGGTGGLDNATGAGNATGNATGGNATGGNATGGGDGGMGTDGPLFENVAFGEASEYVSVPAGDYSLAISPAAGGGGAGANATDGNATGGNVTGDAAPDAEPVATVDVTLEGGTVSTAFATGYVLPAEAPADAPLEVVLSADGGGGMGASPTPTTTPGMGNETGNDTGL